MTATPPDPATDPRAAYDYVDDDVERPGLVRDLDGRVEGDVRFDTYTRELYATDASAYEITPIGVVFPRATEDVAAVMTYCAERGIPVLPRGGGTSLAGQAVNEAVVLDFTRYMDAVLAIDPEAARARTQAGAYVGDLNDALRPHGLKFGPDPAYRDKSAIGGAIGNNSSGSHSLVYGKTDAYVESCEVVLADGTVTTFEEVPLDELRARGDPDGDIEARVYAAVADIVDGEADAIRDRYPQLKRNVSGYNLDRVIEEAEDGAVNLARLLCGSEGTLAIVTAATVSLEPVPATSAVALLRYGDLADAMADVAPILEHDPCAVESMDAVLLDLARDTEEFGAVVDMLPADTGAVLLVEFYADSDGTGRERVADLLHDRVGDVDTAAAPPGRVATGDERRAIGGMEAHDADERARFWKLRKSGLPILLGRTTDEKHISFIEDCAVPPDALPEYVEGFREILEDHGTSASFYGHAGPGVLHVRPLVNTKTVDGVAAMEGIAEDVADLVVSLDGAVSGEHGDGRARTQWNRRLYGDRLWGVFRDLKTAFDPDWLLNPGQVCGDVDMTQHLRFGPDYAFDAGFEPELEWAVDNGFQGMAELCHGCGGCRGPQATTGGVMCPTFRAAGEEITSTRGRANMLRQAMSGDLPDGVDTEFMREVLDLCIGCKGCARDCPSEVDLAKLKVEVEHAYHEAHGASLRERVFADIDSFARLGSTLAPVSNWATRVPGARRILEATIGIARDRDLPRFRRDTFRSWFADRESGVDDAAADRRVLVLPDTFTNHVHPDTGRAAVRVLEAAGVHVDVPDVGDTGRPAFSKGFIDRARTRASELVDTLAPRVRDGWDVVVLEPSDAVMLQSDYADLVDGDDAAAVMAATYGFAEYLAVTGLVDDLPAAAGGRAVTYHGHCHQKSISRDGHAARVLRAAGYDVERLDSGCCGMAGSFGYEAEHASMSRAIASILYDQIDDAPGDAVCAPGASCRSQLAERYGDVPHPADLLDDALAR